MEKINVKELNDNVFETIGKEWMLVCAGNKDHFNMMTASWGCLGWLWNKPVAVVFIRPERFTHGIIEENEFMTLSFLGNSEEARKIYNFCGSKSGRDLDKVKETGLIPVETDNGITAIQMDIKIKGINEEILTRALAQAREGRLFILGKMLETLPAPRAELSPYAPRILQFTINPDKIREVIGTGGDTSTTR